MDKVNELQKDTRPLEVSSRSDELANKSTEFRRYCQELETSYRNRVVNYTGIDEKARQQ